MGEGSGQASSFWLNEGNLDMCRILHIAVCNIAGVPLEFVRAERALGYYSRLITFTPSPYGFGEDICLHLPLISDLPMQLFKGLLGYRNPETANLRAKPSQIPPIWRPRNRLESWLINLRDLIWKERVMKFSQGFDLFGFDVYQLDGGSGFTRRGEIIRNLKQSGKRIVCCYLGSDLRIRGVIPEIDELSDLNLTVEFDHLSLHPNIHHIFFPFNPWNYELKDRDSQRLKICHSPSQRRAKGTEKIISTVRELEKRYPVELVLIEDLPHDKAIELLFSCDIAIDQLGELGYGISSLESLSMGIPTCSCLLPDYESYIPDHPFINVNEGNLREKLVELIQDESYRRQKGLEGRRWVESHHDYRKVAEKIHLLYRKSEWAPQ